MQTEKVHANYFFPNESVVEWQPPFIGPLDKKGRLEIGLKLPRTVSSRPGFLSSGLITATFSTGST